MKTFITLFLVFFFQQAFAAQVDCLPATSCSVMLDRDGTTRTGCKVVSAGCNVTGWNSGTGRWDCRVVATTGKEMFVPAGAAKTDFYNFTWAQTQAVFARKDTCTMSAVDCPGGQVTWGACSANVATGAFGSSISATDSTAPGTGTANFTCYNGFWSQSSGSCGCNAGQTLTWGGGCSATTSSNAAEGGGTSLTSTAPGWTGHGNFSCSGGTWVINSNDCFPGCPNTGLRWGGSNECGNSPGTGTHGASVTLNNAIGGYVGSARWECNNGSWTGPLSASCNPNLNCEAGASPSGSGGATPTSGCRCNTAGQNWCLTTISCEGLTCPSGSGPGGAGEATSTGGCNCNNAGEMWSGGGYCFTCPGGTSRTGTGGAATSNCYCNTANWTWNGSSCVAPANCTNGSIRMNVANGASETCTNGNWVNRPVNYYCTPPSRIDIDDDSRVHFHQSVFGLSGSNCFAAQASSYDKASMAGDGDDVHDDDSTNSCRNNSNCMYAPSTPSGGASCPALTIGWIYAGYTCYGTVPSVGHGSTSALSDTSGPDMGRANATCQHGNWVISASPISCNMNCAVMNIYGTDYPYCTNGSGASISTCCSGAGCVGNNSACGN